MRKYLHQAPRLVLLAGCIGAALRFWMLAGGTDEKNLYPAHHPAWILLCIFSILAVAAIWMMTRIPDTGSHYRANFPPSVLGGIGYLVFATGIVLTAVEELSSSNSPLAVPSCVLGIISAVCLYWAAILSYTGKRTPFFVHALPCFYFALRLFLMGRILGAEPEISRFLFRFLAALSLLPALYQRWAFDVDLGNRRKYLLWNLIAGYFCLVAVPGSADWILYLTAAIWLLTSLCSLKFTSHSIQAVAEPDGTEAVADITQMPPEAEENLPEETEPEETGSEEAEDAFSVPEPSSEPEPNPEENYGDSELCDTLNVIPLICMLRANL